MKFPHYFMAEVKNKETGEKELKEFECVGTAYMCCIVTGKQIGRAHV